MGVLYTYVLNNTRTCSPIENYKRGMGGQFQLCPSQAPPVIEVALYLKKLVGGMHPLHPPPESVTGSVSTSKN